jgi:intracellular sulfur oxidation DsrE/DsrF family protein
MNANSHRRAFLKLIGLGGLLSAGVDGVGRDQSPSDPETWLTGIKGRHKMVYDSVSINQGYSIIWSWVFMDSNNQNGIADPQQTAMVVFRNEAVSLALSDEIWSKYKLGKILKINDRTANVPATTNPYWDPPENEMPEKGMSLKALMARGAMFCVCDRALGVTSTMVARARGGDPAEIKRNFLHGLLPGIQPVPSGVWAVNRAQELGCSYCFAG